MNTLTNTRKSELRSIARINLGIAFNTPLAKLLKETNTNSEEVFYKRMQDFEDQATEALNAKVFEYEVVKQIARDARNAKRREAYKIKVSKAKQPPPLKFIVPKPYTAPEFEQMVEPFKGQLINVALVKDGVVVREFDYQIPTDFIEFRKFTNTTWFSFNDWHYDSDVSRMDDGDVIEITVLTKLTPTNSSQTYREGEMNCLLTPILAWAEEKIIDAKAKSSKERYITIRNKIKVWLGKYVSGVPEDCIAEICNDIKIGISVELPFQKKPFISHQPETKMLTTFKFLNTRNNHVDELTDLLNITRCTQEELTTKLALCIKTNITHHYTMSCGQVSTIYTNGRVWSLSGAYLDFIHAFEKHFDIGSWKINLVSNPELSRFLDNSCHYNTCFDMKTTLANVTHIDQSKAYKNFKVCKFYNGFLSKITDFRKCSIERGLGIYQITDIVIRCPIFKKYNDTLCIYKNGCNYPSPALAFLRTVGRFKILGGCWGMTSDLDMDWESDVSKFTDKEGGVSYYAKYVGSCNSIRTHKKYFLRGSVETANVIRSNSECEVNTYPDSDLISVWTKNTHVYHLSHVTAFILEYTRLNIIEQLMNMSYDQVVRINSDGIYYTGDVVCVNNYRVKESLSYNTATCKFTTYHCSTHFISNNFESVYDWGEDREFYLTELASGGGGSGKTHFNLMDKGLIGVIYVAPSWKLARNKALEYGCRVGTHASLLLCDPTCKMFNYSTTMVIDESSMLSNESKNKIISYYSARYKLIFCGDIKYQIPFIQTADNRIEFSLSGFDNIMEFGTDYRAKCERLIMLKNECRELIDLGVYNVPDHLWGRIQIGDVESYQIDDMILSMTNAVKDTYTKKFTGKFLLEKYYITATTGKYSCGDIIICSGGMDPCFKPEIRHAFTVHSIQGETAKNNLYIHKSHMSMKIFYTAISRAEYLDKIFILG